MQKYITKIVYGVVDKNNNILTDQTSFYFKRYYAVSACRQLNESVVEKYKPYKVKRFKLTSL